MPGISESGAGDRQDALFGQFLDEGQVILSVGGLGEEIEGPGGHLVGDFRLVQDAGHKGSAPCIDLPLGLLSPEGLLQLGDGSDDEFLSDARGVHVADGAVDSGHY